MKDNSLDLVDEAIKLQLEFKYKKSLDLINEYLEKNPNDDDAIYVKILGLQKLGKNLISVEAGIEFEMIVRIKEGFRIYGKGQFEDIAPHLLKMTESNLKNNENLVSNFCLRAATLLELGKIDECIWCCNQALDVDPFNLGAKAIKDEAKIRDQF